MKTAAPATGPGSEKYQRILDAAVEVIAERGYFNSPVSAIAKRAGVADGTIYLYFKSKDDVLRTAIDTTFAKFYQQVEERFATLKGPREQLEYIAELHLESASGESEHGDPDADGDAAEREVYCGVLASSSGEVHPGGEGGGAARAAGGDLPAGYLGWGGGALHVWGDR